MRGGKYKVERVKVNDDRGDRIDIFNVPIKEVMKFASKGEARDHGAGLAHAFIARKYAEGTKYRVLCKTRVEIPPEVSGQVMGK
jgi:hypothetical protein